MSLASVHPVELHSSHSSLATLSHSLDDITGAASWSPHHQFHSEAVMTIEELRNQLNCCFSCGVSWADSHVSLDCSECGGYALSRPCPACDGACGALWKRDLSMSHASGKARWTGECSRAPKESQPQSQKTAAAAAAHELSTRLEKLSANS
ncbi:hypothetical protein NQ318_009133 [Aromia moschata]|uniref:Protein pinocchio n=1 Tax=Aromia moschata TaxID=1265417 RepID=A0AAV8XJR5_9CUCU|nr:hypothetical protein NQ318_009133 [Aromia moschata]